MLQALAVLAAAALEGLVKVELVLLELMVQAAVAAEAVEQREQV
jgi:hypothetical protein